MIEVIAGVWLTAFCLSMVTVGVNFYLTRKKMHSTKLRILNANLEKVGLFWSNSAGNFMPWTPTAIQEDAGKAFRQTIFIGFLGLASVPGFLLLLITVLSIHLLARSRKEKATFRSPLAKNTTLTKEEVEVLVKEFAQIN